MQYAKQFTAEEKKQYAINKRLEMRTSQAKLAADMLDEIINGDYTWTKPWQSGKGFQFPKNAKTGKIYQGINIMFLWANDYESALWGTLKQIFGEIRAHNKKHKTDFRLTLREGEEARQIIRPVFVKDKETGEDKLVSWTWHKVYNLSQFDGELLPKWQVQPVEFTLNGKCNLAFETAMRKLPVKIKHGLDKAYYIPSKDYIGMPSRADFNSMNRYYHTVAHEAIHATGHESRLNRFKKQGDEGSYAFEELVAEMGAAFTAMLFGFEPAVHEHAAYIKSWAKAIKKDNPGDAKLIFTAASRASKAVSFLYDC